MKRSKEQSYNQKIISEDNSDAIFTLKESSMRITIVDRSGSESRFWSV